MSFLKRIFGKAAEPAPGAPQPAATQAPPRDPASDPNMIRVFDAHGRELFITKEQWRDNVLLGNLEKAKGDPDKLANLIIGALQDGFAKDVIPFAEHLHATDSAPARGATLLGVVYLDVGRPADAERVLRDFLERHGEDAYVLTNLAKAQDARGDHQLAETTLWRSIQLDPNQDNGFGWYAAIRRDRDGEAGWLDACRRVAALPSSWRAQLWLARDAIQRGDLPAAISLYQESLSHAGHPAPGELLKQLSGDLGNAGHLNEIVSLVAPQFDVTQHGLEVGNNLIKANLELGRLDEAKRIIEQLYAQGRPDWRPTLEFWDTEVAKTRVGALPAESDGPLQMEILSIEGPLWLRDGSPCASLVAPKPEGAPRVLFFGSTTLMPDEKKTPRVQLADGPGRLSRALPLVLAEQVHLSTAAAGVALIPWIGGKGFALFGTPYGDAELCALTLKEREPPTLIGAIVLDAKGTDWSASLRLIRVADGTRLGTVDVGVSPDDPAPAVDLLASRMIASLGEAGFATVAAPAWYRRPDAGQGSNYLLRLEQQLAVTCGNLEFLRGGRLSGEHEIIEGAIGLCLGEPANVTARLLLAQTLRQMKKARPQITAQYKTRTDLLQREHPVAGEAGACISKALGDVFPAA
jgi:tetratricopeptide (TPR) repeat protein